MTVMKTLNIRPYILGTLNHSLLSGHDYELIRNSGLLILKQLMDENPEWNKSHLELAINTILEWNSDEELRAIKEIKL